MPRPIFLIDQTSTRVAGLTVERRGDHFEGTICFDQASSQLRNLFDRFEEIVEGQMFSLLDEIEEKVESLAFRVAWDDGHESSVKDLQVFPSRNAVSFKAGQPASMRCEDLLGLEKFEAFPLHLLRGKPGEWLRVQAVCREAGLKLGDELERLFATWLPDPAGAEGHVIVLFYDEESMWTMAAQYNRKRLLGTTEETKTNKVSKSA